MKTSAAVLLAPSHLHFRCPVIIAVCMCVCVPGGDGDDLRRCLQRGSPDDRGESTPQGMEFVRTPHTLLQSISTSWARRDH